MAALSSAQDEKSAMHFVDDAIDLGCLDWGGSSGPPSSILQIPAVSSPGSPPSSSSSPKQSLSLRVNNYRTSQSSGSLTSGSLVSGSSANRKLPEIAFDFSSTLSSTSSGSFPPTGASSSSGHFGVNGGVSLPSPSSSSSQLFESKKPFLMASLAIGLNEVIPGNDDDDGNDDDHDRGTIQPKASPGRSPKKFQLGLSQKSPSYALAPSPKNSSPTGGNGSKLLSISLGGGSGGSGGNSHAMLKFDPIMGGGGGSSRNLDQDTGAKSRHSDPPCNYRKTIASRSPLRDRLILGNSGDSSDFMAVPPKSNASFASSSPSKLDPLETESTRGSSLAPTSGTSSSAFSSERKSMKLPSSSSSSPLHSSEKAQPEQKQPDSKATTTTTAVTASPDKPSAAQPKFRISFKNPTATGALGDKSQKGTSAQDDDIDLLGDAHHSSMAQVPVPPLTPMDEFNYLSFSPRPGVNSGKQTARDLPSLSLSSDAKDNGATGGNSAKQTNSAASSSPKKIKKIKDNQQEPEQAK